MVNAELLPFLDDWAAAWSTLPAAATAAERRAHFEVVARGMRQPTPPGVDTEECHIDVAGSGRRVRVRLFRSAGAAARPALVYLHGGGWFIGSPETHWDIAAGIAAATAQLVISVDYALAPQWPFPAAVDDCRAVVEWAFAEAAALGIRADAIAVGGDSAGANLAAALALVLRDTPWRLRGQLLVYPPLDFTRDRASYRENADGPLLTTASMPIVDAMYCPDPADRLDPRAAPLRAASHAGLPPAFIAVAEHDPLRDDGLAYAEVLRAAGVAVELDRGAGLIHGYLRAMAWCADARAAFDRMCRWLDALYQ